MKFLLWVLLPTLVIAAPTFNIPGISSFVSDAFDVMRWKLDRLQDVLSPTTTTPRPIVVFQPYNPPPSLMHIPPPSMSRNFPPPLPPPTFSIPPPNFNIRAPPPFSSAGNFAPPLPPSAGTFTPSPVPSAGNFAPPAPPPPSTFESVAPPPPPPSMPRHGAPSPMEESPDVVPPADVDSVAPPPFLPGQNIPGQSAPDGQILTPPPGIILPETSLPLESFDDGNKLKRNTKECRLQDVHGQLGNTKYYFSWNDPSVAQKNWIEADLACSARCMKLVSLDSAAENTSVKTKMRRDGVTRTWTSGKLDALGWHWAANQTHSALSFQDWFQDQPDNRQTCLSLHVELNETRDVGGWHSFNCDVPLPFMCES